MSHPPKPPSDLDCYALAAWSAGYRSAVRAGIWRPPYRFGLEFLAMACSQYVRLATSYRISGTLPPGWEPSELVELQIALRRHLCDWHILGLKDVLRLSVRADGLDADIAALCGLSTVH